MSRSNMSPLIKAQVEKLTLANRGNPLIYSSAPTIIAKKSIQTNSTSASFSIVVDQMSSVDDLSKPVESNDNETTSLPILESTCQQLEHSAARDRIAVKNKRRQAIKEKLIVVEEPENNPIDVEDEDEDDVKIHTEKQQQQPFVDLKDLDFARSRLRAREHSADKHVSSSIQRTTSFKPPNQVTKEHIYDNFDLYKHQQHVRLRPVTMYIPTNTSDNETIVNELENAFKQLKKSSSHQRSPSKEKQEIPSLVIEESKEIPLTVEQTTVDLVVKNNHKIETSNRRRTVGGINLMVNKKIASDDQQPKPSWIEIAKQKQSKFESELIDENSETIVVKRNEIINSSTEDTLQSNRISTYEQRTSPTRVIERDSIRALKAANPKRINNLIQLFERV